MQSDAKQVETVTIATTGLSAEISRLGAELIRLQDEAGRDLLWNGDPAFWTGRSPLLFPIVGRLKNDTLRVDGQDYPMRQHGIVRTAPFDIAAREDNWCRMALAASETTRRQLPFDFLFEATYRIDGATLAIEIAVTNRGGAVMPVSMGFHPALRWPLPYGAPRGEHAILFETAEPEPIRQLDGGLLALAPRTTPVEGRRLLLNDDLFSKDALIFDQLASRALRYGPSQGRGLKVAFPAMPQLGIWTKPGAGFVCIEPWYGTASPVDFDGEFSEKPGTLLVAPGDTQNFGMTIALDPA